MSSAAKVLEVEDPVQQKRLGDRVKGLDEDKWQGVVHEDMFKANMAKFTQHSELGDFLKSTRPKTLVEANPHDLFWVLAFISIGEMLSKAGPEKNI